MQNKDQIKILLSRTWSPGNIGSVVRAMKNFGFRNLTCCNQINHNDTETAVMAAGAVDLVENVKKSQSIQEETKDCQIVYAFTARNRKFYPTISPHEMAKDILSLPKDARVALLFGNETNGLNNEELDSADKIVQIPAENEYSSLNLAHAVLIALYELQLAFKGKSSINAEESDLLLNHQDKEFLTNETVLAAQKIINKEVNNPQIAENIRHFFKKSRVTAKESRFIHSLFRLILRRMNIRL